MIIKISHHKLSTWGIIRRHFYISEITNIHVYIKIIFLGILKHFPMVNMQLVNRKTRKQVWYRLVVHRKYRIVAGMATVIIKTTKPKVTKIKRWYLVESCSSWIDRSFGDLFLLKSIPPLLFGAIEESGKLYWNVLWSFINKNCIT